MWLLYFAASFIFSQGFFILIPDASRQGNASYYACAQEKENSSFPSSICSSKTFAARKMGSIREREEEETNNYCSLGVEGVTVSNGCATDTLPVQKGRKGLSVKQEK